MTTIFPRILLLIAALLAGGAVWAEDPPARVGRLGYIENDVQFSVDRSQRGEPASINWPISSGAVIESGRNGRAEAWIGSTAYRLGERSRVEFAAVDDRRVDLRLEGGSLAVSILDRDQAGDIVVETPDGLVRFATTGRYRIDVYADSTELSVLAGQASFDDHGRVDQVAAGQELVVWSDGRHSLDANRDQDDFDRWVAARENATLAGPSRRYVSPRMTGYADLDGYGDWQSSPEYGEVWYPRGLADDWAPYRYGRWVWVAPWGWTWVDAAPWGFAPFHYGRWALVYGRWAWIPGSYVAAPIYAPALVAWVGGPSFAFGVASSPAVGWFPLGPREVYVPSYRYSPTYLRQVNVTHVHDVRVIERVVREGNKRNFEYQSRPQAVTVVTAQRLREGAPITRNDLRSVKREELERAPRQIAPSPALIRDDSGIRSPLLGGASARPSGDRARDFRQALPERRDVGTGEIGRRSLERRQPEEVRRPDARRGSDLGVNAAERREAPGAETRPNVGRPPEPEATRSEGMRGGGPTQQELEGRRNFGRRPANGDAVSLPETAPRRENSEVQRNDRPIQHETARPSPEMPRFMPEIQRSAPAAPRSNPEMPRFMPEIQRSAPQAQQPSPEMPKFMPEIQRSAPQVPHPAPQPVIREAPRSEPPRMQAPQGGGGREERREERRDQRREERGR